MTEAIGSASGRLGLSMRGDWTVLLEQLLGGVVHASNNRFTALMSLSQLAELEGAAQEDAVLMQAELARLHEVISYVAALVSNADQHDALQVHTVLETAVAVHALHPRMRMVACTVQRAGTEPPVRVPRADLLRLMLLMIDAAKRASMASTPASAVLLHLDGDERAVRLRVASTAPPGADAQAFAHLCGGVLAFGDDTLVLELPSLAALRTRERGAATTPTPGADA